MIKVIYEMYLISSNGDAVAHTLCASKQQCNKQRAIWNKRYGKNWVDEMYDCRKVPDGQKKDYLYYNTKRAIRSLV